MAGTWGLHKVFLFLKFSSPNMIEGFPNNYQITENIKRLGF